MHTICKICIVFMAGCFSFAIFSNVVPATVCPKIFWSVNSFFGFAFLCLSSHDEFFCWFLSLGFISAWVLMFLTLRVVTDDLLLYLQIIALLLVVSFRYRQNNVGRLALLVELCCPYFLINQWSRNDLCEFLGVLVL